MSIVDGHEYAVVLVTVGSTAEGERIAEALVGERLAACVNVVGPVRSIYRWDNAIQHDEEWLLVVKTRRELLAELEQRVQALHSYQTPEVIALPITAGAQRYLDWLWAETDRSKA